MSDKYDTSSCDCGCNEPSPEKVSKQYFGCAGCSQPGGDPDDMNWCRTCGTYKYFGWIDCECGECDERE